MAPRQGKPKSWMDCLERMLIDVYRLLLRLVAKRISNRYPTANRPGCNREVWLRTLGYLRTRIVSSSLQASANRRQSHVHPLDADRVAIVALIRTGLPNFPVLAVFAVDQQDGRRLGA
jgi:hypothetical protein